MPRGRPVIYEDFKQTSINVPIEHLRLLKSMDVDMGRVCREAIAEAVGDERQIHLSEERKEAEKVFEGMPKEWLKGMMETYQRHPELIPRVLENVKKEFGITATKEDIEKLIPKV